MFSLVLKQPLNELLPRSIQGRLVGLANSRPDLSWTGLGRASLAILIGASTHLFWDSFTHQDRWGTQLLPILDRTALTISGKPIAGYKVLQYGSTLVFLPALILGLCRWLAGRTPEVLEAESKQVGLKRMASWMALIAIPLIVATVVFSEGNGSAYDRTGRAIKLSGTTLGLAVLAYCTVAQVRRIRMFRAVFRVLWWTLAVVLSVLAFSSYFAYSTAGFDFESPTARGVDVLYLRLRWDDGSTWVGFAVQPCPRPNRPLDWFDPGGTVLDSPTRPDHRSRWNDLGFWRVEGPSDDPYVARRYSGSVASRWWACPSWLILLVFWFQPFRRRWKSRR
jgi:hypothetical protein